MIFNFRTHLAGFISVAFLTIGTFGLSQGNSCATSVPVTDLTGAICATATPSGVNTITPPAGCVDGIFDTWFSFVAQGGTATITVSETITGWRPEFIVASSSDNTCAGTFTAEQCYDQAGNYTSISGTINGLTIGQTYWVIVSSNGNLSTGTISTCVNNPAVVLNCVDNDACIDAATITLNAPGGAAVCVADCNNGANPGLDFVGNVCEDSPNPTVWYEFTTSSNTATIDVSLSSFSWTNPEFTIYVGNSCTAWTTLDCVEGTGGAASSLAIPVSANTTYVIAVSDATGDQGNFDLCITQNADNSACNTSDALVVSSTSMGSPLGGPYMPGEVVSFCYSITNWTQFNCNYIGAVVPTFGSCWDPASFNAQGMPVNISTPLNVNGIIQPCPPGPPCAYSACAGQPSGAWSWFTTGSATYNVNGYYSAGAAMPAGWYFLSSYNPATGACTGDPTDPDFSFGDGNFPACGTNTFDYTLCFSLIAGPAGNCGIGATDCSVSIKTFADGEFGAWNNLGCTGDIPAVLPAGFVCCATAVNAGTDVTICSNVSTVLSGSYSGTSGAVTTTWSASPAGALAGLSSTTSLTPTFTPPIGITGPVSFTLSVTDAVCTQTDIVVVTVNAQNTITAGTNQTVCVNSAITNISLTTTGATGATFSGLPAGVSGTWAGNTITISGTPTASGTFNYTVTTTGGCPPATTTGTITVNPINTITAGSNQTVCINSALTNITMTTTGATGATFSGLPAGVTGAWAGNVATISGTPTVSGTFNYTVTTTGGCPPAATTGTITVTPLNTITAGSNQTVCINSAMTNITMTTTGATGATFSGLPAGVTGVWAGNVATISGTPTVSGTFNYTVTTTGGCPPATTTGTITVTPLNTITAGSNQTVCINSTMTNITMTTTGATGATFAGLPAGVSGSWVGNTVTISGTPTLSGTFNYTVTTTGGCPPATTTGTITVTPLNTITAGSNQTVCINSALANITMNTTGATGATFSGLPAGVTGAWAGNIATISGTPTVSGTFNYTVTTTGGCPPATTTGTITVTPLNTITAGSNQTICINSAISNITMSTTGATGATFSGLPAGITGAWVGNIATISGTPTVSGTFNYTVTTTGGCPPATTTGTITVTPLNTITAGSNQTICINSSLTNITLTTTGATGATFSGLPAGVTGAWAGNIATISGTPTASGTFNYTVTTTGGCPPATTTGTITVTPLNTITAGSNQTVCINSALTNITMTTTGATGATFSGLPSGVTGAWAGNIATISGTPTVSGTFNYTVTTTGGCPPATTTGTITVTSQNTITAGSNQTVCINSALTNITITTTGATGATFSGLPAGVSGAWAGNTVTIFGTPTASGTFNYTVTTTGGCPPAIATGTITVVDIPVITLTSADPASCNGTDGFISVSGSGIGTIFWSGTASGSQAVVTFPSVIPNLGAGNYNVYFVNAAGCQSLTVSATLNNPGAPVINPISNVNNCGISYTLPAITGTSLNNPQYYTGPLGTGAMVPVGTVYNAPTNTILYAYDQNGVCSSQQSFTIIINALPTVTSVNGGATYCAGATVSPITVSVTGSPNWSIAYTLNGIAQVPISSATSPISLGSAPGTYVVTNITDANCTNTASGTQTITINALPTVTGITGGAVYCSGDVIAPINVSVTGVANWSVAYTLNGVAQVAATGSSSPISLGNSPGVYVVTSVTDANCTNTASGTQTITINALPTATSVSGGSIYCAGDVVAPINVSLTGAADWSIGYTLNGVAQVPITGASSPISLGNAAGVYVVTSVTDANCTNTASGTQTITINSLPTVTGVSGGAVYCAGDVVSPITVSVTGSANWSIGYTLNGVAQVPATGVTSPISLGNAAGVYVVTSVADANCTNTASGTQTITLNALPTVTSVTGGAVYCSGYPLSPINVAVTGSPNWSVNYTLNGIAQTAVTGGSSPLSLGTTPGIYVVTNISDANCSNTASGTQTITVNALPAVTGVAGGAIYCAGDAITPINVAVTGSANWSIDYTLNGVAQTAAIGGSSPISLGTTAGVYVVTNVTDANCTNTASGTQTITINSLPTATTSGGATYCAGDIISNVNVALTGSPSWTVNYTLNGTPSALTGGTSPISLGNAAGTYVITSVSDALCSNNATGTQTITINPLPTATISGGAIYCIGDVVSNVTVAVTGSANWTVNYTLDGTPTVVSGSSSPISLGNTPGTYILTSVGDALCSNSATGNQTITINPLPTATISGGATYCAGDIVSNVSVAVTGTANWTVDYTLNGTPLSVIGSSSPISLGNAAGVYTLIGVTDALCSNTAIGTETIIINPLPTFTLAGTDPTLCNASDGFITISGLSNNTAYDVAYNAVATANYTSSATGTIIITGLSAGAYNNFVVTLSSSGCVGNSSSTITLNNPGAPVLNDIADQTVCDSYTLATITGIGLSGNEAYWTGAGGTGNQLAVGSTVTSNQTIYIYDISGSCFDEETFTVTVNNTPSITNPGNQSACATYALPAIIGTNLSGNEAYYTNSQALGGTVISGSITSNQTVWIYDAEGACSDEESFIVTINPLPTVTAVNGGASYCAGDVVNPILVTVTGTPNWSVDYTLNGFAQTATGTTSPISLGNAAGVYVITNVSDLTCTNTAIGSQTIIINAIPSAPAAGTDTTYCSNWELVPMTSVGTGGTMTWYDDASLINDIGTGGTLIPADVIGSSIYYVTETLNGCESVSSQVEITIQDCEIIVPTAFTPDADNVNDFWEILDLDEIYPNNIVMVYNRWGNLLFQSEEGKYSLNPWKGEYQGAILPVGSYYFIIDFQDVDVEPQKGIVSIILN
ncbi:MAG: gliding motility-associated C-terminal domain-containing protein [Crocinitomicaceae bacterium]|nr:gliding motility-associated C-terminal domain-containing protein [Crocinitomicaceae bacterium]